MTVYEFGSDKAPGPGGFTFAFMKKYWKLLKVDIFEFVSDLFLTLRNPLGCNGGFGQITHVIG